MHELCTINNIYYIFTPILVKPCHTHQHKCLTDLYFFTDMPLRVIVASKIEWYVWMGYMGLSSWSPRIYTRMSIMAHEISIHNNNMYTVSVWKWICICMHKEKGIVVICARHAFPPLRNKHCTIIPFLFPFSPPTQPLPFSHFLPRFCRISSFLLAIHLMSQLIKTRVIVTQVFKLLYGILLSSLVLACQHPLTIL